MHPQTFRKSIRTGSQNEVLAYFAVCTPHLIFTAATICSAAMSKLKRNLLELEEDDDALLPVISSMLRTAVILAHTFAFLFGIHVIGGRWII